MNDAFDVWVDYNVLCELQGKLEMIVRNLSNSTEQMSRAIQSSQQFLAGYQFEKAKNTTAACVRLTMKTENNINHAMDYLESLKTLLEEYGRCKYGGEAL